MITQTYPGSFPRVRSIKDIKEMTIDYCGFSTEKGELLLQNLKDKYVLIHSNGWKNTFVGAESQIQWFSEPEKEIIREICLQQGIDPNRFPYFFMKYREFLEKAKENQGEILGFISDEAKDLLREIRLDSPPKGEGYWIAFI